MQIMSVNIHRVSATMSWMESRQSLVISLHRVDRLQLACMVNAYVHDNVTAHHSLLRPNQIAQKKKTHGVLEAWRQQGLNIQQCVFTRSWHVCRSNYLFTQDVLKWHEHKLGHSTGWAHFIGLGLSMYVFNALGKIGEYEKSPRALLEGK